MLEWPPKSYVNRIFNIKRWKKFPNGGHFAALEEPDILVSDILSFFNKDLKNKMEKNKLKKIIVEIFRKYKLSKIIQKYVLMQ